MFVIRRTTVIHAFDPLNVQPAADARLGLLIVGVVCNIAIGLDRNLRER